MGVLATRFSSPFVHPLDDLAAKAPIVVLALSTSAAILIVVTSAAVLTAVLALTMLEGERRERLALQVLASDASAGVKAIREDERTFEQFENGLERELERPEWEMVEQHEEVVADAELFIQATARYVEPLRTARSKLLRLPVDALASMQDDDGALRLIRTVDRYDELRTMIESAHRELR